MTLIGIDAAPVKESASTFDKAAWNKSDAAKASRRKYRHDKGKWTSDAKYLSRVIVAVDGEGVNNTDGSHAYMLLAISDVTPISNPRGLSTYACLDYLHNNLAAENINVIYGGSYDFNCWAADLDDEQLAQLYHSNYSSEPLYYEGFLLRWIKGKGFEITRDDKRVVISDVISFFQQPFIDACDEYLGKEWIGRDVIVREKQRRGNFTVDELLNVTEYNALELDRLVELVTELRLRLNKVNLRPRRWDGPGAIAAALFLREGVRKHMADVPDPVAEAARYAYAGGHFEMLRYGAVTSSCWEYDVNSAYPRALTEVPSLAGGKWRHYASGSDKRYKFALYKVKYTGTDETVPSPMFHRAVNGTVSFPLNVVNWIWSPEMDVLREYCAQVKGAKYTVLETWEFVPATDYKPFHFINKLYEQRRKLKAAGDGAHIGIKLALNSMYGKLAQQTGYVPATNYSAARIPRYHCLPWAGFVTSWCRARVMRAALTDLSAVIAFETDALFSMRPLPLEIGDELGAWEMTEFESLTYVQSGHYYATLAHPDKDGNTAVVKCRGIDKGFISRERVEQQLALPELDRVLEAELTRFYGAGIALARGVAKYWRKWITEPKYLNLLPMGKRQHGSCECDVRGPLRFEVWHKTFCPVMGGVSHEYPVEWINPNPQMSELSDMRQAENYFDD